MFDGYLYVASGANGLVKVGRTANPKARETALKSVFRKMGDELRNFSCTDYISDRLPVSEYELIDFSASFPGSTLVSGREFFKGVDYCKCLEKAKEIAKSAAIKKVAEDEIRNKEFSEYQVKRKKMQDARNRWIEKLKKQHFSEFIELQKSGQLPIPEVTTKEAKQ